MCSTSACAPSAISRQSARSTPKKLLRRLNKSCIQGCCVQRHGSLSFLSPAHRRSPHSSAKYVAVDASSPPKRAKKHRFPRLQTGAGCPLHAIDISECTFFALLIYQFASPHPGQFNVLFCHNVCNISMFRNRMFTKLLQNSTFPLGCIPVFYAKWRNIHVAQFFEPSLFISAKASILA